MTQKNRICFVSIDVEHDLRDGERTFAGVENLNSLLSLFGEYNIPATLFVTGEVLKKYSNLVKKWGEDYEIASHGYSHEFWNTLTPEQREKELREFVDLYESIFQKSPIGFRAPSHVIDEQGMELVRKTGFLYDSSVVPHYPPLKKYRGYKGRAPLQPYNTAEADILELPNTGQLMGIPLVGTWIRKLPLAFYKILFFLHKPRFVSLSMHSWDSLHPDFYWKLEEIIKILKKNNYTFLNGEQILKNRK